MPSVKQFVKPLTQCQERERRNVSAFFVLNIFWNFPGYPLIIVSREYVLVGKNKFRIRNQSSCVTALVLLVGAHDLEFSIFDFVVEA